MGSTTTLVLEICLVLICIHVIVSQDVNAEPEIQLPRRSAEMYWVNRALPNKYRRYRTYNALQSIAPEEKRRYSKQLQMRLAELLQQ